MYILDTDHLSLIQRNGIEGKRILARLAAIEEIEVAVTPFHLDSSPRTSTLAKSLSSLLKYGLKNCLNCSDQ